MTQKTKQWKQFLTFTILAGFLFGCNIEEDKPIIGHSGHPGIKISEMPLKELLKDSRFNAGFNKIPRRKNGNTKNLDLAGRSTMEDQFGFTITNQPVTVMETDSITSYTMHITRDGETSNNVENLVLQINNEDKAKALILNYKSSTPIVSFENFSGTKEISDYLFDESRQEAPSTNCVEIVSFFCENHADPGMVGCWATTTTYIICWTSGAQIENNTGGGPATGSSGSTGGSATTSGNGLGGGGPASTILTSPTNCRDCVEVPVAPCEKIQSLNTKFSGLKQSLVNLATTTTQSNENGTFIDNAATASTPNPIQSFPAGTGTGGNIPINMNPTAPYIMIAHTHDASGSTGLGTYSIFSWDDLAVINNLIQNNHIDNSQFVFYVITADGTCYALTIDNPSKLSNFFYNPANLPIGTQLDMDKFDKMQKMFNTYYNPQTNGLITATSNPTDDKANFLKFMKEANLGVSLFEVDATFTNYQKLSISNSGVVTLAPPCN